MQDSSWLWEIIIVRNLTKKLILKYLAIKGGFYMPSIRPSSDLRNKYDEISKFCRQYSEPVFITKNGHGDLVVMSIETYERLAGKLDLYKQLQEGHDDIVQNRVLSIEEAFKQIHKGI